MLYLNSLTGKFVIQPGVSVEDTSPFAYVRGDQPILPLQFCDDSGVIQLPDGSTVNMVFKQPFGGALLATCAPTLSGTGADAVYTFMPAFTTAEVDAALLNKKGVHCAMEILFQMPAGPMVSATKYGRILSELFTGGESGPTPSFSYPRPIGNNQLPGEANVFTSAGGNKFRFNFNDDGSFDVIRIL